VDTLSIADVENPAEALRAELASRRLTPAGARVGIERPLAVVKPLTLPATGSGNLPQMVQFELERHLPFQGDDAAFDFLPLGRNGDGQQVLVVACERRTVDQTLRLLADMRLKPTTLTVAVHDLVPLLARRPRTERAVWIHQVGHTANLLFLVGNSLALSRSVPVDTPTDLVDEIRSTLAMLRWAACDAVWVSGDGMDHGWHGTVLAPLGAPIAAPPFSVRARRSLELLDGTRDGAELLAGAVAVGPRWPAFNLLPAPLRPRRLTGAQKITIVLVVLTAGLGLAALVAPGVKAERELAQVEAQIRALDAQVRAVERTSTELERARRLLASARELSTSSLHPLPLLRELTDLLPPDAWLTALTLEQKGAELVGQAATASALIPLLEDSPRLERVEFASPVTKGRDKEQFRVKAVWEQGQPARSPVSSPAVSAARPQPQGRARPSPTQPDVVTPARPVPRRAGEDRGQYPLPLPTSGEDEIEGDG
jgi:general secretion pathway protein L